MIWRRYKASILLEACFLLFYQYIYQYYCILNFCPRYKLFADEILDTSQDTSSSSGQSKRKKETLGEVATSSGTKNSASKRKKR